jgi:hypothetical protein
MEEDIWESLRNFEYDDDYKLYGYPNTKEQQAAWYQRNKDRLKAKSMERLNANRDEINRKRREARATEPYRSEYLRKQRERRSKK